MRSDCIVSFIIHILIAKNHPRNSTDSDYGSTNRLPDGDDKKYPFLTGEDCDELYSHCPFSLLDLSTYTDV